MTTGTDIVGTLLREDAAFTRTVPVGSIKAGALPENVALPVILLRTVSSTERKPLKAQSVTRTTERVSASVRAGSYRDQVRIIRLIRDATVGKTGAIGGGQSVAILHAGTGPDLRGPGNSFEQTIDLRVSFDATAGEDS